MTETEAEVVHSTASTPLDTDVERGSAAIKTPNKTEKPMGGRFRGTG
ncbi:hypothetical protein EYZ11_007871 [Aspergillus tanneri]|uniref:Uncharacterized protein n=1 Tax=Aspergillus tanneri TaxID=1220188 RepID=A0A4S3JHF9_9EURO|nr:hypothetical protein EYZ11_007871 [Aspergillus tanneri]